MRHTPLFAALLAIAAPAAAQEQASGTITGTLDLDPAVWYVREGAQEPRSQWQDAGDGRLVRLVGYPDQDPEGMGGAIVLDFEAAGTPTVPDAQNARITYYPEGADQPYMAENKNVDLSVTALHVLNDEMAVTGSFNAIMTPGGAEGLVIDAERDITVDGNFQATVYRP